MFGYVKISEDELLVRNLKKYKNAYCALCKQIGCYSQAARMMLSYDMVFCVLLIEANIPPESRKCRGKMIRRCKKCCGDQKLQYIAAVSIILQHYKIVDDISDGKRKRIILLRLIEKGYQQAKNDYPEIDEKIACTMGKLTKLQEEKCIDFEILDKCFASILYDICILCPDKDSSSELRGRLSMHVGAWVYWFDMLQDLEEDRKEGNFNVVLLSHDEKGAIKHINNLLIKHLSDADDLCELLPFSDEVEIIRNIVTIGLPKQMCSEDEMRLN